MIKNIENKLGKQFEFENVGKLEEIGKLGLYSGFSICGR